eukprot:m.67131 g.67131  ORF g.67131 m.67131 type:complete len:260 (+) comp11862_c1_seq1:283-1062(+)
MGSAKELIYYHEFETMLMEVMAHGGHGYMKPQETQALVKAGLMPLVLKKKVDDNKGIIAIQDLKSISQSQGLKLDQMQQLLPFGVRHLTSSKQMKMLKTELAQRHKEKARLEKLAQKLKQEEEKELKLREKEIKQMQKADEAKSKLERKSSRRKSKSKQDKDESLRRREAFAEKLKTNAELVERADHKEALEKWKQLPAHTRYKATKRLVSDKEGYLDFDVGDYINVTEKTTEGHFVGILARNGTQGIFPGHYVTHSKE